MACFVFAVAFVNLFAISFAFFCGGAVGALLRDVRLELTGWEEGEHSLQTRWRFSGIVDGLPWRPLLAAAGGTKFVFDKVGGPGVVGGGWHQAGGARWAIQGATGCGACPAKCTGTR